MKLGATPIDDEEELWCFHGCAVQMMELPYLCDSAAGRGGGSCGASGAGCTPGACSSASSRRFGGDDAAFVVGGGGDNAPDKAPPVLATDSPPRSGAASPASLQPAEPEAAEGGAVEGRAPHVPPPTALAEAVEGIEDANRCGRSVAEAEIARLLQLVGQVAAPLAGEAYPRWDHLICDALAEDEPPAGCPSPSKRTVSALALQYCRELLDRCRSSPAAVTLFKATASSGTFAPSATNSGGGGGDGEPGARGAAAPAAAAAEHRPLPPAPAPVPLPGTELPVPARSAVVREVAAQRGDPAKLRVVVDAPAGAAEPRKRVGVVPSSPSPSPSAAPLPRSAGKAGTFGKQAAASPAGPGPGSRTSPEAGEDQWGYAGAKFEARVVGCWWPVQVVEPAAFQLKMRKPGLKVKVAYAQDATDTWWVDSATGLRLKEDGKWSDGLAQCLRSVGRCQHRGCLAAMQTIARNEDPPAASPTDAAASRRFPDVQQHAPRIGDLRSWGAEPGREAEAAPQAHPAEAIPLERVDSAALHRMLCFLDGQSLAVLACTCSTFRTMAADDAIWRHAQLRHHRHPVTNVTVEGAEQTWHETYMAGVAVDLNWRRRRCNKTEWNDHSDHLYHVHQVGDLVITASADHTLRVFPLRPRNMPAEGWDADMGEPRRTVAPEVAAALRPMPSTSRAGSCLELAGHFDHVTCCSTLDAGRIVISVAVDDCLKVWELPSGKCVATQRGVVGRGFCKFTLPDWSWSTPQLVCASMSGSGVRVWDMAAWEETAQLGHAGQEFYSVCTPAGSALVLGAAGDSQTH
eukprot:jgi/Tetstr1/445094/TSEL_032899.t1